jgi:hypothetical protein
LPDSQFPPEVQPSAETPAPRERLAQARERLRAALDGLDSAIGLQAERALAQADQEAEFVAMQANRSQLALDLHEAQDRLQALAAARAEVLGRVERAGSVVRAVLANAAGERAADHVAATGVDSAQED